MSVSERREVEGGEVGIDFIGTFVLTHLRLIFPFNYFTPFVVELEICRRRVCDEFPNEEFPRYYYDRK
eukprot:SAG11_NODE_48_length_20030_cov_232.459084_12_plen_68_part_00